MTDINLYLRLRKNIVENVYKNIGPNYESFDVDYRQIESRNYHRPSDSVAQSAIDCVGNGPRKHETCIVELRPTPKGPLPNHAEASIVVERTNYKGPYQLIITQKSPKRPNHPNLKSVNDNAIK